MRAANPATDLTVDVEGIGTFTFARRKPEDVYRIRARYARLTEDHYTEEGNIADMGALGVVSLQALMVAGPEGFSLEALDPLMSDDWESIVTRIFVALRAKELSLNPKIKKAKNAAPKAPAQAADPEVPAEVHEPVAEPHVAEIIDAAAVAAVEAPEDVELPEDKGNRDLFR